MKDEDFKNFIKKRDKICCLLYVILNYFSVWATMQRRPMDETGSNRQRKNPNGSNNEGRRASNSSQRKNSTELSSGGTMEIPKNSRVVETIVLEHNPTLDLDKEVDRLVSVARAQCDKEKNSVRRKYEQDIEILKANFEDQLRALRERLAVENREKFDKEVAEPLRQKLKEYEADIADLKRAFDEALRKGKETQAASDDLRRQIAAMKEDLLRLKQITIENEALKQDLSELNALREENERLKRRLKLSEEDRQKIQELTKGSEMNMRKYQAAHQDVIACQEEKLAMLDHLQVLEDEAKVHLEDLAEAQEALKRHNNSTVRFKSLGEAVDFHEVQALRERRATAGIVQGLGHHLYTNDDEDEEDQECPTCVRRKARGTSISAKKSTTFSEDITQTSFSMDSDEKESLGNSIRKSLANPGNDKSIKTTDQQTSAECAEEIARLKGRIKELEKRVEELTAEVNSLKATAAEMESIRATPSKNLVVVVQKLGALEVSLAEFNRRYDVQMGSLKTSVKDQDDQCRASLKQFSVEIKVIKDLIAAEEQNLPTTKSR